jgi:hypothetical protein
MTNVQEAFEILPLIQEVPGGTVPLYSPFYVPRPLIEAKAYTEIAKSGSLLRIKAPQKMGKSTLMLRLIHHALSLEYHSLYLDLQLADHLVLSDPNRFLRWFCAHASRRLGVKPNFEQHWDETSSQYSCFSCLQALLEQVNQPVVILCNEVNRIFDYPALAQEFLPLVRSLYEASHYAEVFQKLRLVLAYSTEVYVPLQLHRSPFNVGLTIELPEFTLNEIQSLANVYGLGWAGPSAPEPLMLHDLIGGHPYLVHLAHYHLASSSIPTEEKPNALFQLLETAPTLAGIYKDYLQYHLSVLHNHPDLAVALQQVLASASKGSKLSPSQAHKLQSLGLIKLKGELAVISCKLYQLYFSSHLRSFNQSVGCGAR